MANPIKATALKIAPESQPETEERAPIREGLSAPQTLEPQIPTGERAHDRWFLEQRGNRKLPKKLDIPNEVQVGPGGPLRVTGNLTLVEEDGTSTHANHLTLCRCGSSNMKPICDGRHLDVEFFDPGSFQKASDCVQINRPQTLTITCVENGPLKLRGFVRIHNRKGQEFLTMQTSLCRCGKSTDKPFCDCQ
ncbi:MAG: CDGSH iron-sulfur domain-containing protein [Lysobacterales bacterium]|jgi:CDGSH-type Zn-finger protein